MQFFDILRSEKTWCDLSLTRILYDHRSISIIFAHDIIFWTRLNRDLNANQELLKYTTFGENILNCNFFIYYLLWIAIMNIILSRRIFHCQEITLKHWLHYDKKNSYSQIFILRVRLYHESIIILYTLICTDI